MAERSAATRAAARELPAEHLGAEFDAERQQLLRHLVRCQVIWCQVVRCQVVWCQVVRCQVAGARASASASARQPWAGKKCVGGCGGGRAAGKKE